MVGVGVMVVIGVSVGVGVSVGIGPRLLTMGRNTGSPARKYVAEIPNTEQMLRIIKPNLLHL